MKTLSSLLFAIVLLVLPLKADTITWKIDPVHSRVQFSVQHLVISEVTGRFKEFDASLVQTKDDLSDSKLTATVMTKSIDTDNDRRDGHLKSADFFDAEKYPEISFVSKSFVKTGKDTYKITGDLTMRGVTKEVVLDAKFNGQIKDPAGNIKSGFSAKTTINRIDYGVKWNKTLEAGGLLVGENVDITLYAELVKQTEPPKK
jgi:polyisoprenoid-binding protein YceI